MPRRGRCIQHRSRRLNTLLCDLPGRLAPWTTAQNLQLSRQTHSSVPTFIQKLWQRMRTRRTRRRDHGTRHETVRGRVNVPHIKEDLHDNHPNHHLKTEPIQVQQQKTIQKHWLRIVMISRKMKVVTQSDYVKNVSITLRGDTPTVCHRVFDLRKEATQFGKV